MPPRDFRRYLYLFDDNVTKNDNESSMDRKKRLKRFKRTAISMKSVILAEFAFMHAQHLTYKNSVAHTGALYRIQLQKSIALIHSIVHINTS